MKCIAVFQGKLKNSYCTFNQENNKSPVKINIHVFNLNTWKTWLSYS